MINNFSNYDVIIHGAGPSGALAAFTLCNNGQSVLLIDKSAFPRQKPCGGGLTIKALNILPFQIDSVLRDSSSILNVGLNYNKPKRLSTEGNISGFVVRSEFDNLVFKKAIQAGAEYRNTSIAEFEEGDSIVEVHLKDGTHVSAKYLIGADGANSIIRRKLASQNGANWFSRGFAIEGIVPNSAIGHPYEMEFDFGIVPYGYGWIFPKGDHACVGIYTSKDDVSISKDILKNYAETKFNISQIQNICGFPVAFGGDRQSDTCSRVVLIGDAAGFTEHLIGEGLHNAFKSGISIANHISQLINNNGGKIDTADILGFQEIRLDLKRCRKFAHTYFYPHLPTLGYYGLCFPLSNLALMRGFAAGKTFRQISNFPMGCHIWKPLNLQSVNWTVPDRNSTSNQVNLP